MKNLKNSEYEKFEQFLKEKDYPLIKQLFSNIFELSENEKNNEYGKV